jgi:hydro-lyases, Fe-S type, tartrate/fumarate subfamily, alpha region
VEGNFSNQILFVIHVLHVTMIKLQEPLDDTIVNILRLANTKLPKDIGWSLEAAAGWETNPTAYTQLGSIMDNVKKAEYIGRPMCQDTGIPIFYVSGNIPKDIEKHIAKGIEKATELIPLRPNTVHPLTRKNPGNNLGDGMPMIHYHPTDDDFLEITVVPKGAGSENMTKLIMLDPSAGEKGVKDSVVSAVLEAGGRPCPPTVVGVGIGGTADVCVQMAKEALLEPIDKRKDPEVRKIEEELFTRLNQRTRPYGAGR